MKISEIKSRIRENEDLAAATVDENTLDDMRKKDKALIRRERKFRNFQRLILYIFVIFFIIWLLFFIAVGMTSTPNEDMRPAFHGGDLIIFDRLNRNPGINDVIVFEKAGTTYMGRVIAKGGDKVEIVETGGIKVNDAAYIENYIYQSTLPLTTVEYPLTLEEDEFFVLVDARESGEDSRFFGPVNKKEVLGRTAFSIRRTGF